MIFVLQRVKPQTSRPMGPACNKRSWTLGSLQIATAPDRRYTQTSTSSATAVITSKLIPWHQPEKQGICPMPRESIPVTSEWHHSPEMPATRRSSNSRSRYSFGGRKRISEQASGAQAERLSLLTFPLCPVLHHPAVSALLVPSTQLFSHIVTTCLDICSVTFSLLLHEPHCNYFKQNYITVLLYRRVAYFMLHVFLSFK